MTRESWQRISRILIWIGLGLGLFAFNFLNNWASSVNTHDESWFLQVLNRFITGEVLYKDIFLGVPPLSIYITSIPILIFGSEILVIKAVLSLSITLTFLLCIRILQQLNRSQKTDMALLLLGLQVYAAPILLGTYQSLALIFSLICLSAVLFWYEDNSQDNQHDDRFGRQGNLLIAGIAAGMCFATKQNTGFFIFIALLAGIASFWRRSRNKGMELARAFTTAALGFGLTIIISLMPIISSGAFIDFFDYSILNKSIYLQKASVPYFDFLSTFPAFVQSPSLKSFSVSYKLIPYLLPAPLGIFLIAGPLKHEQKRHLPWTIFLFCAASFLTIFPRVDVSHMYFSTPLLLMGIAYSWNYLVQLLNKKIIWVVRLIIAAWLMLGLGLLIVEKIIPIQAGSYNISTLPHFRGALFPKDYYSAIMNDIQNLNQISDLEPFLFLPNAGFYYLTTGIQNSTPYDYPLVTAFGLHGERDVINAIQNKEINTVCLLSLPDSYLLKPKLLDKFVRVTMTATQDIGPCVVYINKR